MFKNSHCCLSSALCLAFSLSLFANLALPELSAVPKVDLNRYLGLWYEIARFPNKHQVDCLKTTAQYSQQNDGTITVKNSCTVADGKFKEATGIAKVEDKTSMSKLKVSFVPGWLRFFGIGWGNYWIIELDSEYQYAVVSEPKREYLWVLSRTPMMSKDSYDGIISRLQKNGFDTSRLIVSAQ